MSEKITGEKKNKELKVTMDECARYILIDGVTYVARSEKYDDKTKTFGINYEEQTKEQYLREIEGVAALLFNRIPADEREAALKNIIKEAIAGQTLGEIRDLKERLSPEKKMPAKIKKVEGCFEYQIGGKRGRPASIVISGTHPIFGDKNVE